VLAALSTGELIDPVNGGKKILKRAQMQRRLARKLKHSNNWNKLKGRISRGSTTAPQTVVGDVFCIDRSELPEFALALISPPLRR
jgi:hypothetical protein